MNLARGLPTRCGGNPISNWKKHDVYPIKILPIIDSIIQALSFHIPQNSKLFMLHCYK